MKFTLATLNTYLGYVGLILLVDDWDLNVTKFWLTTRRNYIRYLRHT